MNMGILSARHREPNAKRFEKKILRAAADLTADTALAAFGTEAYDSVTIWYRVTAQAGGSSPTLDVHLQTSYDGGTTWVDIGSSAQHTAAHAAGVGQVIAGGSTKTALDAPAVTTDGTLAASSRKHWPLGDQCRVKLNVSADPGTFTLSDVIATCRRD